ncbi:MAG: hypothetical protein M3505_10190 [Verrucomicrobiota bacterium]|nr:hypothetical protein [Verrucomicrobiota bacterium]
MTFKVDAVEGEPSHLSFSGRIVDGINKLAGLSLGDAFVWDSLRSKNGLLSFRWLFVFPRAMIALRFKALATSYNGIEANCWGLVA